MILAFDSETTGVANFRLPPEHPTQPRIIQLGAILYDDARHVRAELNLLVKPDGFTIPAEATAVHGITTEHATRYGLAIGTVVKLLLALTNRAELIVAHNVDFDRLMVLIELARLQGGGVDEAGRFAARKFYCTMKQATAVCQIPSPRGFGYKWPNLQEAHQHFFGRGFEGAHDAMADVRACAAVYYELNRATAAAGGAES